MGVEESLEQGSEGSCPDASSRALRPPLTPPAQPRPGWSRSAIWVTQFKSVTEKPHRLIKHGSGYVMFGRRCEASFLLLEVTLPYGAMGSMLRFVTSPKLGIEKCITREHRLP